MNEPSKDTGLIARSAGKVSGAVMCSRVLGLVREQVFAILFGAGFSYDAFVIAFRVPNLLRDLFGEGALSASFVTVFSDYDTNRDQEATMRLAGNVILFFLLFLSLITLLGVWQAENIVRLLVEAEFESIPGKVELTRLMTVIMFPFLIFISMSSICMGILNSRGHFFVPSLASSFFNMGSIIGGVGLSLFMPRLGQPPIVGMAVGTLIGGFLQLVGQFPSLKKAGFVFRPHFDLSDPGLRRILKLMVPAIAGLAALQLNVFINSFFASSLQEGSLSWLNYAFRLFMFPLGVFGVAISIAAHPVMARQAAAGSMNSLRESYVSTLTMGFCLTVPAAAGLIMLAEPVIGLIFQYGRFDHHATIMTAEALAYYALGLAAYTSVKVTAPVFYNINETRYPVVGSFLAVAVNFLVVLLTIDHLQHRALALSISCAMMVNFLFLFAVLHNRLNGFSLSYIGKGLAKVLLATAIMIGWLYWIAKFLSGGGVFRNLVEVMVQVVTGAFVYGVSLYFLKFPELLTMIECFRERVVSNRKL